MNYVSIITTSFHGPTNTKGARIKCVSPFGSTWHEFDYAGDPHGKAAEAHCRKLSDFGEITAQASTTDGKGYHFVVSPVFARPTIWVLLRSERGIETYDDQFCAWWASKPDPVELRAVLERELHTPEDVLDRVLAGEDPKPEESVWWRLKEVKSGPNFI